MTIQFKRGTGVSALADGEPGWNTSTKQLWVGQSGVNYIVSRLVLGTTPVNGTSGRVLYDNAGAVGEYDAAGLRSYLGLGTAYPLDSDTDATLAANSDLKLATQKAVKTYADQLIASADAMVFKGVIDCSANPNYPAADKGWTYRVSVAGKIGGASGPNVEVGDLLLCLADGTASGNQATVGTSWSIAQTNIDGAVVGPSGGVTDGHVVVWDGASGKLVKTSGLTLSGTNTGDVTLAGETYITRAAQVLTLTKITLAQQASVGTGTVFYRKTAGTGAPETQTLATLKTDLGTMPSDIHGLTAVNPALGDELPLYNLVAAGNRNAALERLLGLALLAPQGRLTLDTILPVADSASFGSIQYRPYLGPYVVLHDGSRYVLRSIIGSAAATGLAFSGLGLTANRNYDVWLYDNSGNPTLELSAAWNVDNITRTTAISLTDGRWTKDADLTRFWLGTIRMDSSTTCIDVGVSGTPQRFVWNAYNRVPRTVRIIDSTASWSYSTATCRQANGNTANKVEVVCGLDNVSLIDLGIYATVQASLTTGMNLGIGEDTTTAITSPPMVGGRIVANGNSSNGSGRWTKNVAQGYHAYNWNEIGGGSGTITWFGTDRSGVLGTWMC